MGDAAELAPAARALEDRIADARRQRLRVPADVRVAAAGDEVLDALLAGRDQFEPLGSAEAAQRPGQPVRVSVTLEHAVPHEPRSRHPVDDVAAVVLELEDVPSDELRRDLVPRGRASVSQHRDHHERLVDMRHPHALRIENERLEFLGSLDRHRLPYKSRS